MTWLLWRQHRGVMFICAGILGGLGILLWITGVVMADDYHAALAQCSGTSVCSLSLFRGDGAIIDTVNLTIAAPLVFGLFWGAPLIAREIETGTHTLVWTQGVSRRRWLAGKLTSALLAAAVWGAAIAAVVTWWSGTLNSLNGDRFDPVRFDIQGIVPVGYSLFAVSLGIAAGALIRRTMPALAVTVAGYAVVRLVIENYLRPYLMSALTRTTLLTGHSGVAPGGWVLQSDLTRNGRVLSGAVTAPPKCLGVPSRDEMNSCLDSLGFRFRITYQPANRYWTFQFVEAAIFLGLTAVLVLVAVMAVRRRDA